MNNDERKETKGLTGVMTVRSGRWLPPAMGWLDRMTSPSFRSSPRAPIYSRGKDIQNKLNGGIEIILKGVGHEATLYDSSPPNTWLSIPHLDSISVQAKI